MSHLLFDAKLHEALRMEGDLPRGPVSRLQRKAQEQGVHYLSVNNENSEHIDFIWLSKCSNIYITSWVSQ